MDAQERKELVELIQAAVAVEVAAALIPIEERLDKIEDSVSTIRRVVTDDIRPAIDGMRHDIQNLYRGQAEIRRDIQSLPLRQPEPAE